MTEKQQSEGTNMMCSDMKYGYYKIREGAVCYYQISVSMIKIVEQLLAHDALLNEHVNDKSFKIRATAKENVPEKNGSKLRTRKI